QLDVHAPPIHIHRLFQAVVRDRMSPEERASARRQVHSVLAACRPPQGEDVDDPDTWPEFRKLWPHLEVSDTVNSTDEAVRQLLVARVGHRWGRGDCGRGGKLSRRIEDAWSAALELASNEAEAEAEAEALRRQLLHLRFNLANVLRSQASFEQAKQLDQEVLAAQS